MKVKKFLKCVYQGKSSFLVPGEKYWAMGESRYNYFIEREGFPRGKIYSKKHFEEIQPSIKQRIQKCLRDFIRV